MAQSRAKRMQLVLDLALKTEEEAAQKLSQCREQVKQEEAQMLQLRSYSDQYLQEQGARKTHVSPQQLINYSGFIQRLNQLCVEQEHKIARLQGMVANAQKAWQVAYQKRKSIEELIARLVREEAMADDKRQQKELDELASLRSQYNNHHDQ